MTKNLVAQKRFGKKGCDRKQLDKTSDSMNKLTTALMKSGKAPTRILVEGTKLSENTIRAYLKSFSEYRNQGQIIVHGTKGIGRYYELKLPASVQVVKTVYPSKKKKFFLICMEKL
jgi:transcription-repair coupling factor (superfamily II helicase)